MRSRISMFLYSWYSLGLVILVGLSLLPQPHSLAQDWAAARLDESPRHQEWQTIPVGDRKLECFIVYPEVKEKATSVLVIHEIFGLSDWVRSVADQLAEAGYIAIAPDLLSGLGENQQGTKGFPVRNTITKAVSSLPPAQVTGDLQAALDYVIQLPAANGTVAVAGFCWGGSQTFRFATNNAQIKAAFVFYGDGPMDPDAIKKINCPVYGFYGENDQRVNATIEKSKQLMSDAGKTYEPMIYAGAGHGFMRAGEDPAGSAENKQGRTDGWERLREKLQGL